MCIRDSTLAMLLHTGTHHEIVYDGFTRTHDEIVSHFDIPDQDAWAMHFAGKCARAITDASLLPMQLLQIDLAYELIVVLPHMWWRKVCGLEEQTQGCGLTRGLYWFSNRHTDFPNCTRTNADPANAPGYEFFQSGHPASNWLPPGMALRAHFRTFPALLESQKSRKFFKAPRPRVLVVLSNIPSPANEYSVLTHEEVGALARQIRMAAQERKSEAEILYIDSLTQPGTASASLPNGLVHGSAVYQKLINESVGGEQLASTFQEVQLRLMAYSSCFVAPHGGANYVSLFFGRPTVLLHPSAEVADSQYGINFAATLPLLGGSRVVAVTNTTHMNDAISELISSGTCE
eukprot:TRINITY_DN16140_c0_g1_i2.p1 TRINITY_DN16140_c0_g1~~TRINITY_DN16140_c0_g1_i2.p1  ORF type:complete len:347 (+),score=68.87 TRINITY_DN16140_c0_g1_i2:72-1112(+)